MTWCAGDLLTSRGIRLKRKNACPIHRRRPPHGGFRRLSTHSRTDDSLASPLGTRRKTTGPAVYYPHRERTRPIFLRCSGRVSSGSVNRGTDSVRGREHFALIAPPPGRPIRFRLQTVAAEQEVDGKPRDRLGDRRADRGVLPVVGAGLKGGRHRVRVHAGGVADVDKEGQPDCLADSSFFILHSSFFILPVGLAHKSRTAV